MMWLLSSLWFWAALWLLMVMVLFALLWHRVAERSGVSLSVTEMLLLPVMALFAGGTYWVWGNHPETAPWISDYYTHHELVQSVIDGQASPEVEKLPLPILTRLLQQELAGQPSAEGWYGLSLLYSEMKAPAVAITAARKAVQMAPEESAPKLLLARSLIAQQEGQLPLEAETLIKEVVTQVPRHDGAWMMLGSAAMTSARYELAVEAFDDLLSRHPEGEAGNALHNARAEALNRQKNQSWLANLSITVAAGPLVEPGGTLFVFLRKPGDKGQPLAAIRTLADRFPLVVTVGPGNWLQEPPAPGTALVAGARYAMLPGQSVDQAAIIAENQRVIGIAGQMKASLALE